MLGIISKVMERRGLTKGRLDATPGVGRAALVAGVMTEADALHACNRELSRQLVVQLAGNSGRVTLSEHPDGTGCFYGRFEDGEGDGYRVDVMPPRPLWTGDIGEGAADPDNWLVLIDGEEVQRASRVDGLSALGITLVKADR